MITPTYDCCSASSKAFIEYAYFVTIRVFNCIAVPTYVNADSQLRYLFDWSLPANCPELAKELKIPNYFVNDFLQRTDSESLYRDSWPSLFVAPAGVTSELHVDAFGSNFWMALFEGRKRYNDYGDAWYNMALSKLKLSSAAYP